MGRKKFQKTVEDFTCDSCGKFVKGNGYTDHCPYCLWGKHVDVNPGDRAANCGGAMEPIDYEKRGGSIRIKYKCQKCDYEFWVKAAYNDDYEKIINIKKDL